MDRYDLAIESYIKTFGVMMIYVNMFLLGIIVKMIFMN